MDRGGRLHQFECLLTLSLILAPLLPAVLPGSAVAPDFSLSASPSTMTLIAGRTGSSTISVRSRSALNLVVLLTADVSPEGPRTALEPSFVILLPRATNGSTLTVTTFNDTAPGGYLVTVTGTSGLTTASVDIHVTVVTPDFTVTASPTSVTVNFGAIGTSTIIVTSQNGFSSVVSLTLSVTPSGLSCNLNPTSVTPSSSEPSTLSCVGKAGSYTVSVTGSSGALSHSVNLTFIIRDFTVSANPTSVTVDAGATASSTLTIDPLNGFVGTVNLASSVSPDGLTCSLSLTTIQLGESQTSILSCSGSIGTYTVVVTGTSGAFSHNATITFNVQPVRDFSISASPTIVTILAGASASSTITVKSVNNFTGTVNLTATTSPASGLTCTLTPTSVTLGVSEISTLSCSGTGGKYAVTVTGSAATAGPRSSTLTINVQDFSITATPVTVQLNIGHTETSTVTISAVGGFGGTVKVAIYDISPSSGLTCSILPTSVPGSGVSMLSCTASAVGVFSVTVTGTSGSLSHSALVVFTLGVPDFSLAANPSSLAVNVGVSGTLTIVVSSANGFTGVVSLTAIVPPMGLSCVVSPSKVVLGAAQASSLSCNGAAVGRYTVTITGKSGSITHLALATFTVTALSKPSLTSQLFGGLGLNLPGLALVLGNVALAGVAIVAIASFVRRRNRETSVAKPPG